MPNIGPMELVIILVIALLVIGPGKLPDVGSALGKSIREFRKAATDVQDSVRLDTPPAAATPTTPAPAAPPVAATVPPAATAATEAAAPSPADAADVAEKVS
jgi:sec-independent protein translocase protein TatA